MHQRLGKNRYESRWAQRKSTRSISGIYYERRAVKEKSVAELPATDFK